MRDEEIYTIDVSYDVTFEMCPHPAMQDEPQIGVIQLRGRW